MQQPARILCNWKPSKLTFQTIKTEWDVLMDQLGIVPEREPNRSDGIWYPRTPGDNFELANDDDLAPFAWHRDGHGGRQPPYVLTWANEAPTWIYNEDYSEEFISQPGDVVLIYNQIGYHCLPPILRDWEACKNRFSMRIWCEVVPEYAVLKH